MHRSRKQLVQRHLPAEPRDRTVLRLHYRPLELRLVDAFESLSLGKVRDRHTWLQDGI